MEGPDLNRLPGTATFSNHDYLKEKLVRFCRMSRLPVTGRKAELIEELPVFLEGKLAESVKVMKVRTKLTGTLSEEPLIESQFVCSEIHRAQFVEKMHSGVASCQSSAKVQTMERKYES